MSKEVTRTSALDIHRHLSTGLSVALLGILLSPIKSHADVATGLNWLKANLQTSSPLAYDAQAQEESLNTLSQLHTAMGTINLTTLLQDEHSTELLSRAALISNLQHTDPSIYLTELKANQNDDGGFGHLEGWQSNPLDTAFVLIALSESNFINSLSVSTEKQQWQIIQARALDYLKTQQRTDGSYQVLSLDKLYVSAYVLTALAKNVAVKSDITPNIVALVSFLESAQINLGRWSNNPQGLFIDALVAEALHPFHDASHQTIEAAFKQQVLNQQQSNGSWLSDPYTTALILRSLNSQATVSANNPIMANLKIQVVDAETGLPLPSVALYEEGDAAIQATSTNKGSVEVSNHSAGRFKFTLKRAGYADVTFEIILQQGQTTALGQIGLKRLSTSSTTQIQGRVLDTATNTPIAGAQVTVLLVDAQGAPLANTPSQIVYTSGSGTYQVILPQDGFYAIDIRQQGYQPVQSTGNARLGTTTLYNANLNSTTSNLGSLVGRVVNDNGQPMINAQLVNSSGMTVTTDVNGVFQINQLGSGSTSWTVTAAGFYAVPFTSYIEPGKRLDVGTITLKAATSGTGDNNPELSHLIVNITESTHGLPLNQAVIVAEQLNDQNQVIQTQSFYNGLPSNDIELLAGRWRITVQHPAYQASSEIVTTSAGGTLNHVVVLVPKPYTIQAQIVDAGSGTPLKNIPFTITDVINNAVIYQGQTDSNGNLAGIPNLSASNIRLDIKPTTYLGTSQIIQRDVLADPTVNLGVIRLREKVSDDDLIKPDLIVKQIDLSQVVEDPSSQAISGQLNVSILNQGRIAATVFQPIEVVAFVDQNFNRQYDYGETVLGRTEIGSSIQNLQTQNLQIPVHGVLDFKNAPIAVAVDSSQLVDELKEDNNVALSSDFRTLANVGVIDPYVSHRWRFRGQGQTTYFTIAPIKDDNGDGKVGQGDKPLVFVTDRDFKGGKCCVTVRGIDFTNTAPSIGFETDTIGAPDSPVIADLDHDGVPEIMTYSFGDGVNVGYNTQFFNPNAQRILQVTQQPYQQTGSLVIYDIYHNNHPVVYPKDGAIGADFKNYFQQYTDFQSSQTGFYSRDRYNFIPALNDLSWFFSSDIRTDNTVGPMTVDMDQDGIPEVFDLAAYWGNQGIISKNYKDLSNKVGYGAGQYSVAYGASLNVAIDDIDGDHKPDVVYGTQQNELVAFKNDGTLLWKLDASNFTGAYSPGPYDKATSAGVTIFDLDGDGQKEVITANDNALTIINGKTGQIISRSLTKSPVEGDGVQPWSRLKIADVDGDGHADIIVNTGLEIVVFSSQSKSWANSRSIWNQEAYHITNINDDLSVPQYDRPWESFNSFGVQQSYGVPQELVGDLTTSHLTFHDEGLFHGSNFSARIGNAGGKDVAAGTPISFYRIPPSVNGVASQPELIKIVTLSQPLAAGHYEDITVDYAGDMSNFGELVVVANDAGAGIDSLTGIPINVTDNSGVIQEYTRANNTAHLSFGSGFQSYSLDGQIDKTSYQAGDTINITAIPSNLGSLPSDVIVKTRIIDSAGNIVATLADQPASLASSLMSDGSNSKTLKMPWAVGQSHVDDYRVVIELIRDGLFGQERVASIERAFSVVNDATSVGLTANSVQVDKTQYQAGDIVNITSRLQNTASNQTATARSVTLELIDPTGQVIWTQSSYYDSLTPHALVDKTYAVPLKQAVAGNYIVRSTQHAPDGSQADQTVTRSFTVLSSTQSGVGLAGSIQVATPTVDIGNPITFAWKLSNQTPTAVSDLNARIILIDADTGNLIGSALNLGSQSIAANSSTNPQSTTWTSAGTPEQHIMALLQVELTKPTGTDEQDRWKTVANTTFKLTVPPLKVSFDDVQKSTKPVLVYYSCHDGWETLLSGWIVGKYDYNCFNEREGQIRSYLDRIKTPYTMVKEPWQFRDKLHSGVYGQYWLLGSVEQLTPHTFKEIRESAHLGDNLVTDNGVQSHQNSNLFELAGSRFRGRLQLSDGAVTPQAANASMPALLSKPDKTNPLYAEFADTPLQSITARKGQPYSANWPLLLEPLSNDTQISATFNGSKKQGLDVEHSDDQGAKPDLYYSQTFSTYPAVTMAPYGRGKPVVLAFDLTASLTTANGGKLPTADAVTTAPQKRWDYALKELLASRQSTARSSYVPNEPVQIPFTLDNQSNQERTVQIDIELPSGSLWLGRQGGTQTPASAQAQSTISYQLKLPANRKVTELIALRLPANAGTVVVRTTVSNVTGIGSVTSTTSMLAQQENRYLIRTLDERLALLKQSINNWNSNNGASGIELKKLQTNLMLVDKFYRMGQLDLALKQAGEMSDDLAAMQSSQDSRITANRIELDEFMRGLEIRWYLQRNGQRLSP